MRPSWRRSQRGARLEGVRDGFEEDQLQAGVLELRRIQVVAERVGGGPELGLQAVKGRLRGGWIRGSDRREDGLSRHPMLAKGWAFSGQFV